MPDIKTLLVTLSLILLYSALLSPTLQAIFLIDNNSPANYCYSIATVTPRLSFLPSLMAIEDFPNP